MRPTLALTGLAVAAGLGSVAHAQIIPLTGTQTLQGSTAIRVNGSPVATGGFNVAAPSPIASWDSGPQSAGIIAAGSHIQLDSSFLSGIGPGGVTFSATTVDQLTGAEDGSSTAELDFSLLFDLRFSVAAQGNYLLSASIERAADPTNQPATIRFGAEGQSPLVSLETVGSPWPDGESLMFSERTAILGPGIYTLHIQDDDTRSGGAHSYLHHSKLRFSLTVVPAPASLGVLGLGLCAFAGRRRRPGA